MRLELHGLTARQRVFCDVMWAIETRDGVESFISTLPVADQRECRVLIELMQLAFLDQVDDVEGVEVVLKRIAYRE